MYRKGTRHQLTQKTSNNENKETQQPIKIHTGIGIFNCVGVL